jgi:iron-sulfur cluster repair protein YtfE (RIC family)
MTPDPTDLAQRDALPDALRVLSRAWPRAGWERHPHFEGLVRFWMERHMMFRKIMQTLQSDTEALIDNRIDARDYAGRLSRFGGMFVNELHGHHQIEDVHYFPKLARAEASVAAGFDILDRDHHAIDEQLAIFVKGANAVLQKLDDRKVLHDRAGRFGQDLSGVARLLDRHLLDEEELVVPVILKHGPDKLDH